MKNTLKLFCFLSVISFSCNGSEEDLTPQAPTNLSAVVRIDTVNTLNVSVNASAQDANYFAVNWGDGSDREQNNDGKFVHTYNSAGNYNIKINAHTTADVSVSTTKTVSLTAPDNDLELPEDGYTTPLSYEGYNLTWQDEFDGSTLSSSWTHEIGTGFNGWGNEELQYYRKENTTVDDGYLVIEAKKEAFSGQQYTSSRIITEGNKSFKYGRIDIRALLPEGQGIWPALWMLGSNFSEVGWPSCGEIDIMEMVGGGDDDSKVYGTLHWDNNGSYACTCDQGNMYSLSGEKFSAKFHVFSIIWDAQEIKWYVDDNLFKTVSITPEGLNEFQKPFFFIFNVAVGGRWPGSPNESTVFPQKLAVDYVRVFQK